MTRPFKISVLIVEDEGLIARDIANRLEAMGHQVTAIVSTAKEAVAEAPRADVVLMDIRLDGPGDGIQAAEIIRQHCAKPVVFLTAHADRATLERAKLAVPFGYVVKPVQSATLAATIDVAVYKHRVERELAGQRGLLDAVIASVAEAIAVAGPGGEIQLLNEAAEALSGWSTAEAKGKPILDVLPLYRPGDSGRSPGSHAEDPVPLALLRGEAIEIGRGAALSRRDGRRVLVEGSAAPVHVNGTLAGVVVSLRDITARDWEEGQVRLAHKMESATRLAASVSDEYANLLAVIRGHSAKLIDRFPEYVTVRGAAEEIEQAALAAEKITRRLAGLGARPLPNPDIYSLNGLLRRTRKLLESIAGEDVSVSIQTDPNAGKLWADGPLIEQALINLVVHASASLSKPTSKVPSTTDAAEDLEAALQPRRLTIETGNVQVNSPGGPRPFVRLAVTHSGWEPGADALFDPSTLEDDRLTLSITHNIVAEHGGYLSAFPVPGGYCFEALLPRYAEPESDPAAALPGAVPSILLVEPNELLRRELHNYFEAHSYCLLEASDTAEALALADLHEGSLDVAIATRREARILASSLREAHPGLKILEVIDANADADAITDLAGQPPPDDRIVRPFTEAALLDRVRGLLGKLREPQAAVAG